MSIGETALSAFLQVVFEQLWSHEVNVFLKLWGGTYLPRTLKLWERKLHMMEALLSDAEQKQFHTNTVKLWLKHLQDLAFDMEDTLDRFATQAQSSELKAEEDQDNAVEDNPGILNNLVQSLYASGSRAAEKLSTLLNPVDQDLQSRIDDITERLEYIETQAQTLGLSSAHIMQQQTLQTETLRSQRESTSLVCEVLGRDEKKQEIIAQLLKDEQSNGNYFVIPIVGKGGIGKTTLAQYVYNAEQQLKGHFNLKAWVCVSDVFDVKLVTTAIINSATQRNLSFCNLEEAQVQLKEVLNGKKFLIVLDDIWTENYDDDWDKLQRPFKHGAKGSRVIMTTRNVKTARMMINNPTQRNITHLEGLSGSDSMRLFQLHASEGADLTEFRVDIIKKCNGLPLAAKALGGLFKRTVDERQRQMILDSNIWSEQSNVLPVLRLSYDHLPSALKRVFAYCSVFPKDYNFTEKEVVLLWMAQGFLPENQTETMEDMGHKYFDELVSRSLFERCSSYSIRFTMHDLIHDVALWAAGDICYALDTKDMQRDPKRTRHLFFSESRIDGKLENQLMVSQLRTFLCPHSPFDLRGDGLGIEILNYIQRFQNVRTLFLVSRKIEVIPDSIGDLRHLRFLNLLLNRIKVLPKSISKLYNLQTLDLSDCENLEKVPNISFLVKLRHIYIKGTSLHEMPVGIGKLTNLQTLDKFVLATGEGSRLRELRNLNRLCGKVVISGLENVTEVEDAREAHYDKKVLDELYLEWGTCRDEVDDNTKRDLIEQLQPRTSIKECVLKGYTGLTFPGWLGDPSFRHMVDIRLKNCEKCECLPPLGQLPLLRYLRVEGLDGIKQAGPEFYGSVGTSNSFPALRSLYFAGMKSWEKWVHVTDNNRAFPRLEVLGIENCDSLQGDLPPHLPFLKYLFICKYTSLGCQKMDRLPEGGLPRNLSELIIRGTNINKPIQEWGMQFLTSLTALTLKDVGSSTDSVECISNLLLPSSLSFLEIKGFQNLKTVRCSTLPCLTEIWIKYCPKFESFGDNALPQNIRNVYIEECFSIEQHLISDPKGRICKISERCSLYRYVNQALPV